MALGYGMAAALQNIGLPLCKGPIHRIMPRMRNVAVCFAVLLTACFGVVALSLSKPPVIKIPFESYTLPNGLTVILAPDHATPTVAVTVWYHVGSKNETVGRTGFAHLFEHVMFTGSGHVPYGTP